MSVTFAVEQIIFTKDLQDITVSAIPSDVTFECEVSKEGLKVEWYKGKRPVRRDDKFDILVEGKTHKLVIHQVSAEEAVEYSATYQKLSTSAQLTVAVPPSIDAQNLQVRLVLKAGSAAAVEVPISGCPQPKATWTYKGGKLPDARRFKVDSIQNMSSITMAKVARPDAGKYTLTLENPHGKATFDIGVIVFGECLTKLHPFFKM